MNSFIDSMLGQCLADAIIRAANKYTNGMQYSIYCQKDDAHEAIRRNISDGNRFVSLFESDGYCTIVFEEGGTK